MRESEGLRGFLDSCPACALASLVGSLALFPRELLPRHFAPPSHTPNSPHTAPGYSPLFTLALILGSSVSLTRPSSHHHHHQYLHQYHHQYPSIPSVRSQRNPPAPPHRNATLSRRVELKLPFPSLPCKTADRIGPFNAAIPPPPPIHPLPVCQLPQRILTRATRSWRFPSLTCLDFVQRRHLRLLISGHHADLLAFFIAYSHNTTHNTRQHRL